MAPLAPPTLCLCSQQKSVGETLPEISTANHHQEEMPIDVVLLACNVSYYWCLFHLY